MWAKVLLRHLHPRRHNRRAPEPHKERFPLDRSALFSFLFPPVILSLASRIAEILQPSNNPDPKHAQIFHAPERK
jgi:hypothetical protein